MCDQKKIRPSFKINCIAWLQQTSLQNVFLFFHELHQLHHSEIVFPRELQATFRTLIIISLERKKKDWKNEKLVQLFCVPFWIQTSRNRKCSHSIKCLFVPWRKFTVWNGKRKRNIEFVLFAIGKTSLLHQQHDFSAVCYKRTSLVCAAQCKMAHDHDFTKKIWNFKEHRICICGSENLTKY